MASLTGTKIKDTYDALLKVSDNGALDGTLQTITDGLGNNSALSLSTAGASVGGTLAVSGAATLSSTLGVSGAATLSSTLAVSGNATILSGTYKPVDNAFDTIQVYRGNTAPYLNESTIIDSAGGHTNIRNKAADAVRTIAFSFSTDGSTSYTERMKIYSGGDISFRDSSANEAFYWDASAASLGIGGVPNVVSNYSLITTKGTNGSGIWSNVGGTLAGLFYSSADFTFVSEQRALPIIFETSGIERMRIDSSGNVLIGAESPVGGRQELRIGGNAGGSAITMGRSGTNKFLIQVDSGDNVYLQNTANTPMSFETNGTERMRITSTGGLFFSSLGISAVGLYDLQLLASNEMVIITSSRRYKENIQDLPNTLDNILALRPVTFDEKSTGINTTGLIAEEVYEVLPELVPLKEVEGYDEPQPEAVSYSRLPTYLIKAIQELNDKVVSLEERLSQYEAK